MLFDENGLYFLTAKGKNFYERLKTQGFIALTGLKGADTMSSVAMSLRGKVREIGDSRLPELFAAAPYMNDIYPTVQSRNALTIFQIYEGTGEWFDLSKKPIERADFTFGGATKQDEGYFITDKCSACGACLTKCPENCIEAGMPYRIIGEHCLRCGNCFTICPVGAVERSGYEPK
jgi:uncharacterized pyridoxamine 5'-phosphate oxidase family protein/NAD-dependent dihydropyrimidine dehydrogenase PreA subunit